MTSARSNLRGIIAMCLSCLMFTLNDILIKLASAGMAAGQIIAFRGFCLALLILAILTVTGELSGLRYLRNPRVWFRSAGDLLSIVTYLPALFHMPIGNATVILQIAPLAITGTAAIFLGEAVGWRRWAAILTGFAGVVVVARPGLEGFNAWSLLILVAVAGIAFRDLATRTLPAGIPGLVLTLTTGIGGIPVGLGVGLFEHWTAPPLVSLAEVLGAATLLIGAYYFLIAGMRNGEVAVVSTFRYSFVVYAIIAGYLVWGDVPDLPMLIGAAMILGAGLYVANRERLRSRAASRLASRPAS